MKTISGKNIDLSQINSLSDLDNEILSLKQRVRSNENIIKENFKKIPIETIKVTLGSVLPKFAKAQKADQAFSAVQTLAGGIIASIFNAKRNGTSFKQGVADTFRQVGFLGTMQAVIQLIGGKKNKKMSTNVATKQTENVLKNTTGN